MVSTRQHFWILIILLTLLLYPFILTSQNTISLRPPVVTYLADAPDPKITPIGEPQINKFPPNIAQGKGFFTTFDRDDGLPLDAMSTGHKSALCDSDGNLWFGTSGGGVSKYDGKYFINYSIEHGLPNNNVLCITEDKKGNIWFGTYGGVSKYDGVSFTTFNIEQGIANNRVYSSIEDKNGNLWFGTLGGGVSKYNGTSFTTYNTEHGLINNRVYSIAEDKYGNIWFGTEDGVSKYDTSGELSSSLKLFTNYTTKEGLANNNIRSITEDKKGNIWIGTGGGGVSKYNPSVELSFGSELFETYTIEDGLANNVVKSIIEDTKGNIWFGTNGGISRYDGKTFYSWNTDHGLANNKVFNITEDKKGNLWFGTWGGGVSKYHGNSFTNYSVNEGLANNIIMSVLEDSIGNFWLGTGGGGISVYDGKSFTNYSTEQGLVNNTIVSIIEDKLGNIWLGTPGNGVSKYDGKSFLTYTTEQGLGGNKVFCMIEDKVGNIWFGTYGGGVSKYDGKSFTTYTAEHGLANNNVISIAEDEEGNIWFGTDGGGVSRYDTSAEISMGSKLFTTYTTEQGLANNIVASIFVDKKGNLWFGLYGAGVSILNKEDALKINTIKFSTINKSDGLPDNVVMGIVEDKKGNIIIGTNSGLGIIPLGNLESNIEIYNQFNGYPIRDVNGGVNNGALFCDSSGVIWAGTGSYKTCLVRFDYDAINKNTEPPKVVIQKISVKGEDLSWYNLVENQKMKVDSIVLAQQEVMSYGKVLFQVDRDSLKNRFSGIEFDGIKKTYSLPENLILPYKHNHIGFGFNAIETDRNFLVNYQFMLEGQDENWSPISKKTDVTFGNLHEGNYTFLLKAQSPWGIWSAPIKYSFTVLPPWYRTWGAYIFYVVLLIGTIWSIVRFQTRKLVLRQRRLQVEVNKATVYIRDKNIVLEKSAVEIRKQKEELANKNEQLSKKNDEKTAMLKEIHHRVKNNLQIVNSLLRLQSREFEDEHAIAMFKEAQDRVLSMALLHEKMYRSDDLKYIDIQEHITLLVEDLVKSYAVGKNINLNVVIENVNIGIQTLVPLGLIINEIITNALKYAFIDKKEGEITVHIKSLDNIKYEMIIGDNGVGLKDEKKSTGIGTKLIQIFTKQLNGELEHLEQPGTLYKLIFEKID